MSHAGRIRAIDPIVRFVESVARSASYFSQHQVELEVKEPYCRVEASTHHSQPYPSPHRRPSRVE